MPRPPICKRIEFNPVIRYFKPKGVPIKQLKIVVLTPEEVEALRLKNIENFNQLKAAEKMKISQSTFQRILSSAYKKVSDGLINGKAIKIKK